eukprot:1430517-Rhodomonas_salina.2
MLDVYYTPLREAQYKLTPILSESDIDTIFGNAEDIVVITDAMLSKLGDIEPSEDEESSDDLLLVGDVLYNTAPQ